MHGFGLQFCVAAKELKQPLTAQTPRGTSGGRPKAGRRAQVHKISMHTGAMCRGRGLLGHELAEAKVRRLEAGLRSMTADAGSVQRARSPGRGWSQRGRRVPRPVPDGPGLQLLPLVRRLAQVDG